MIMDSFNEIWKTYCEMFIYLILFVKNCQITTEISLTNFCCVFSQIASHYSEDNYIKSYLVYYYCSVIVNVHDKNIGQTYSMKNVAQNVFPFSLFSFCSPLFQLLKMYRK